MKISVKILFGEERPFEVSSEMSVIELKAMVTEQCNIPLAKQKLLLNGRALVDDKKLSEYDIQEGTKLNVFICQPKSESSDEMAESPPVDLFSVMMDKMKLFWADADARKVADEFVKSLNDNLNCMSLDDIERFALELLDNEEGGAGTSAQGTFSPMTDMETDAYQGTTQDQMVAGGSYLEEVTTNVETNAHAQDTTQFDVEGYLDDIFNVGAGAHANSSTQDQGVAEGNRLEDMTNAETGANAECSTQDQEIPEGSDLADMTSMETNAQAIGNTGGQEVANKIEVIDISDM